MSEINGGFILLSRHILDSQLWSVSDGTFKVAIYLLLKANHSPRFFKMVKIERGQACPSLSKMADECNVSIKTIRHALSILQKIEFITIDKPFGKKGAKEGQRISVCNYDTYQTVTNYEGIRGAQEGQSKGNQGAPIKELEELKEINKCDIISASEKISKLHPKVGLPTKAESEIAKAIIFEMEKAFIDGMDAKLTTAYAIKMIEDATIQYAQKYEADNQYAIDAVNWYKGGGYRAAAVIFEKKTERTYEDQGGELQ